MIRKKFIVALWCFFPMMGGCTLLGFLLNPSASEKSVPAVFPLAEYKDKSVYLLVCASAGSGTDVDVPQMLSRAIAKDLQQKVKIRQENIFQSSFASAQTPFTWSRAEQEARQAKAAFLLYVEIIEYELIALHQKNYYMGKLTARALLLNTQTGQAVWPAAQGGQLVRAAVDFEKNGRSEILWRLTTAVTHCIVREFYNCPKPAYWSADEVKSLDSLMENMD
jgi:hypothetical protein